MNETESVSNRESRIESVGQLGRMCTLSTVKRSWMLGGLLEVQVLLLCAFAATHETHPGQRHESF